MLNKHRVKTFMVKTLKRIDGQAGDSSSKRLPTDLKADLCLHHVVRRMIVKDSDLTPPIPKRPLGIADLVGDVSNSSSSESNPHATPPATYVPEVTRKEQRKHYLITNFRVTKDVVESKAPQEIVLESLAGHDYGIVIGACITHKTPIFLLKSSESLGVFDSFFFVQK